MRHYIGYVTKKNGDISTVECDAPNKRKAYEILVKISHTHVWNIERLKDKEK
jgi:hypothetical protein